MRKNDVNSLHGNVKTGLHDRANSHGTQHRGQSISTPTNKKNIEHEWDEREIGEYAVEDRYLKVPQSTCML